MLHKLLFNEVMVVNSGRVLRAEQEWAGKEMLLITLMPNWGEMQLKEFRWLTCSLTAALAFSTSWKIQGMKSSYFSGTPEITKFHDWFHSLFFLRSFRVHMMVMIGLPILAFRRHICICVYVLWYELMSCFLKLEKMLELIIWNGVTTSYVQQRKLVAYN